MKKITTIRLSELTDKQLEELQRIAGNQTSIIQLAIDRLHRDVMQNKKEKEGKKE